MGQKELKVAFLLALRSLQRGSRSSTILTVLIIGMCFTNMIFLPSMFNGIGQGITQQLIDYEVSNVLVSPKSGEQYINDLDATLDLINGMPGVQRASKFRRSTKKWLPVVISVKLIPVRLLSENR
ncbi:MAG: hypothetical protein LUQ05_06270 [Methanoregula sp.]|nr:hypothetical protein [Methanoregula sp.]